MNPTKFVTAAAVALLATLTWPVTPTHASSAANPNPVDWTISRTIFGKNGEDLPLRVGQHDLGDVDGSGCCTFPTATADSCPTPD